MQNIYKFPLKYAVSQSISGNIVKMLDVQLQQGVPCLWALVSSEEPEINVSVKMVGTGTYDVEQQNVSQLSYIGTIQRNEIVLHVFTDFGGDAND